MAASGIGCSGVAGREGFYRVWDILGDEQRGIKPLIPVKKSTWWEGVRSGRFPASVCLGGKTTAWRKSDIHDWIDKQGR